MTLTPEMTKEMVRRLVAEFKPLKIILFGSQAWGKPGPGSDVDLFVIVEKSELPRARRAARAHQCLQDLGFPKDILVRTQAEVDKYKSVYASLECQVLEKGKILYG